MIRKLLDAAAKGLETTLAMARSRVAPRSQTSARMETLESRQLFSAGYTLVELTLGGTRSEAYDVNALGQVVGYASVQGDAEDHAFFYDGADVIDLGTLGGTSSYAVAVNDKGQVIGQSSLVGDEASHGFYWDGVALVDLSLGGSFSDARFLNESGQAVGLASITGDQSAMAYLYSGGTIVQLDLGGLDSSPVELTQSGYVIGNGATATGGFKRAFIYDGARVIEISTGGNSEAVDVNEAGQVVGNFTAANGSVHAFVYSGGVFTDLGTLGGAASSALKINEDGDILGHSTNALGKVHAFLYRDGVMIDLGALASYGSAALALNEAGQVLMQSLDAGYNPHALLWTNGDAIDLGTLGGTVTEAMALTESGVVFGKTTDAMSHSRAFIFTQGEMADIGPAGASESFLIAFNQANQALIEAGDYYLHSDGVTTLLADLVEDSAAWSIDFAGTLNDQGHILGKGQIDGRFSAFVMSPVVADPNVEPTAVNDAAQTHAGTAIDIDVLANDGDADGDVLAIAEVGAAAHGQITLAADGKLRYTPLAGFVGTDSFVYTITDGRGGSSSATVSITVHAVATSPTDALDALSESIVKLISEGTISRKAAASLAQPLDVALKQLENGKANPAATINQLNKAAASADLLPASEREAFLATISQIIASLHAAG